jgi:hypothetical protein
MSLAPSGKRHFDDKSGTLPLVQIEPRRDIVGAMAKQSKPLPPEQLTLKITLSGSEPKIWRRVALSGELTLHDLHYVIQCVFMWDDSHLYHFVIPPGGKLTQKAMRDAMRYHVMPPDPFFNEMMRDGRADETLIGNIFNVERKQIVYDYDFGDSWEHVIKLEKRSADGDQNQIPVRLGGENAAPFDDMGGIWGYYDYIAALHDESHEMHADAFYHLDENFDPALFDLALANKRLAAAFKRQSTKTRKRGKKTS